MKRLATLAITLLPALLVTTGCIVCPAPGSILGSSQFITYKVSERIPADEWVMVGAYTFGQRFEVRGATGVLNGQIFEKGHRMKTKLRYRLFDDRNVMLSEQIYRLNFKNSGEVKKLAMKPLQKDIMPGYQATLDVLSNRDVEEGLLIGISYNIKYTTETR